MKSVLLTLFVFSALFSYGQRSLSIEAAFDAFPCRLYNDYNKYPIVPDQKRTFRWGGGAGFSLQFLENEKFNIGTTFSFGVYKQKYTGESFWDPDHGANNGNFGWRENNVDLNYLNVVQSIDFRFKLNRFTFGFSPGITFYQRHNRDIKAKYYSYHISNPEDIAVSPTFEFERIEIYKLLNKPGIRFLFSSSYELSERIHGFISFGPTIHIWKWFDGPRIINSELNFGIKYDFWNSKHVKSEIEDRAQDSLRSANYWAQIGFGSAINKFQPASNIKFGFDYLNTGNFHLGNYISFRNLITKHNVSLTSDSPDSDYTGHAYGIEMTATSNLVSVGANLGFDFGKTRVSLRPEMVIQGWGKKSYPTTEYRVWEDSTFFTVPAYDMKGLYSELVHPYSIIIEAAIDYSISERFRLGASCFVLGDPFLSLTGSYKFYEYYKKKKIKPLKEKKSKIQREPNSISMFTELSFGSHPAFFYPNWSASLGIYYLKRKHFKVGNALIYRNFLTRDKENLTAQEVINGTNTFGYAFIPVTRIYFLAGISQLFSYRLNKWSFDFTPELSFYLGQESDVKPAYFDTYSGNTFYHDLASGSNELFFPIKKNIIPGINTSINFDISQKFTLGASCLVIYSTQNSVVPFCNLNLRYNFWSN